MIGMLIGSVASNSRNPIVLLVGGVGYSVHVPLGFISKLKEGEKQTLFVHTYVRDEALDLYGFPTADELNLFKQLLDVSGIGPRTALPVIDRGVESVTKAISESDVDFFTTIPRLGRKNAQKIIIELKSKLGSIRELDLAGKEGGETKEVLDALESMGFARKEAITAIKKLDSADKTIEQKIRRALQYLGKQ